MPVSVTVRVALAVIGAWAVTAALPRILPQQEPTRTVELPSRGSPALGSRDSECDYGGQPYYFVATDEAAQFNATPQSYDMRAFNPRCQPRPLVQKLLNARANATGDRQLSIMLYGDSVDRTLVDNFCALAKAELRSDPEPVTSRRYRSVTWCSTDKFLMMHSWTNGLHPSRMKVQVQSPEQAFKQSSEMFRNLTGRRSPDILFIASCMWDLTHWTRNQTLFGTEKDNIAEPFLGEERLLDYVASLTGYIRMLQTGFPDTRFLAVHTMPQRNPRGLLGDENLGERRMGDEALQLGPGHSKRVLWNNYIAALNGALRHVAAREALPTLDYEGIMLQLPTAYAHARDGFHPQAKLLSMVMLNVLLNEFESSQARSSISAAG